MKKITRRDVHLAAAAASAEAPTVLKLENAPVSDIIHALASGRVTATALTQAYLARIEAYDRAGDRPSIPCASSIPRRCRSLSRFDKVKPSAMGQPLAGVPILVKDNVATGDKQHTTAGSLALEDARAKDDATVVKRLRAAGALILGKANLTEFANILAIGMPSGYSSLGGQVKNPYAPTLWTIRASRSCRRGDRARDGRSLSQPGCARPRSAVRPRARCSTPPARTASSR